MKNAHLRIKLVNEIITSNEELQNMQDIAAKGSQDPIAQRAFKSCINDLVDTVSKLNSILELFDSNELSNKQILLLANNRFNSIL